MLPIQQTYKTKSQEGNRNLRIIIIRHGERADIKLGPHWFAAVANNDFRNPIISRNLPRRKKFQQWVSDTPLTVLGERQSAYAGAKLRRLGFPIDYCYSSPSFRCIQTAKNLLRAQGKQHVPINIEPGMYEYVAMNNRQLPSFLSPQTLVQDKTHNINVLYQPVIDKINISENEDEYYQRSRYLIDKILRKHGEEGGTILLSGHAASIEVLSRAILQRSPRPKYLMHEASKVDYCNYAIFQLDAQTNQWSMYHPQSNTTYGNNFPWQQTIHTTIAIHRPITIKRTTHRTLTQKQKTLTNLT